MASVKYDYTKLLNAGRLERDIRESSIVTALDYVTTLGDTVEVWMKGTLSSGDETTLDGLVSSCTNEALVPEGPVVDEEGNQKVVIKEEWSGKTNGHYQTTGFKHSITDSSDWQEFDMSFPFPIALICAQMGIDAGMDEDKGQLVIAPFTTVGAIAADVSIDDTEITVQSSALQYLDPGYRIYLDTSATGETGEDMGRVLTKDEDTNKITVENGASQAYSASSPTYIKITRELVPDLWLKNKGSEEVHREYGRSRIGGSYLPASTKIRLRYKNNSGVAKTFVLEFEYLY